MDSLEVTLASMEQMMEMPSMESLLHVLQQCRKRQNLICAQLVHVRICDSGLDGHRALGNYLVPMFVNFGRLSDAQQALDRLVSRNEHSWTSLIQGFVDCGQPLQALNLYQKMEEDLVYPSQHTSVAILKACSMLKSEGKGRRLHVEIAKKGYERDSFVGNALVDLYARCGLLVEAQKVFDQLLVQDVVLWNTLMTGYAENGLGEDVLHCLDQMQLTGVSPDAVTFLLSLKACGSTGAIDRGRKLHAETAEKGLEGVPYLGSIMVDMYAKCGLVEESQKAFDHLQARDVVTWTSLIRAYAKHGLGEAALHCLEQMQLEEVSPNAFTFACSLGACASIGAIDKGREIHTDIVEKGLERGSFVCNSLVDMYAKFGLLGEAWKVFDKLPVRDVVSWNIIIAAYAEHGLGVEALNCLEQMQQEGVSRDSVTYICSLKACGSTGVANKGQEVHLHIAKHGLEKDLTIGNTLVDMYAKCGSYAEAQSVFDELSVRDVVSWTALIAGFAEQGSAVEALVCFEQMRQEGVSPDEVTFVCSLKACSSIGALEKGQELHAEVIKEEFETDFYVGNILVDLYAKCGSFIDAQAIFDELPVQDVASWNALITGLSEHGLHEEALDCLEHMQFEGVRPNIVSWNALIFGYAEQAERDKASKLFKIMQEQGLLPNRAIFVSILKACGDTAAREFGKTVHAQIYYACRLEIVLANALIDMYSRCGSVVDAQQVFDSLPTRVLGTWNALITGYARQGEIRHVFNCLEKMKKAGILPDAATFLNVLSVCSHGGLVEKGKKYFEAMYESYCLSPTIKHHNCMVDLLGRAGQVDEAVAIVEKIPFQHDSIVWSTVLGAFRKWGHHHELGKVTFEHPADLDKNMLENSC